MFKARSRFALFAIAATAILTLAATGPAFAGAFNGTFGQFAQVNNANQRFQFTNVTGGATFDSINVNNGGVAINYTFSAFGTQPPGTFGATLTMTSSTNLLATKAPNPTPPPAFLAVQGINGAGGQPNDIHIISNEFIAGTFPGCAAGGCPAGSVILDVTFTDSALVGPQFKHSASEVSNSGVVFSSQFTTFPTRSANAFALSFTSVNPPLAILGSTGFLRNFTAAGTGTFSLTVTPEPASVVLLMIGLALSVVIWRRQTGAGSLA